MRYQTGLCAFALLALAACTRSGVTGSTDHDPTLSVSAAVSSARSGPLNIRKECSTYTGHAGEICTITSSNLKAIPVGSTVRYAQDAVNGLLDTDVILDPPNPGNNLAFGHCTLSLVTGVGTCTFSGGTGKFTWFHAEVDVSPLGGPDFAWDGTYHYGR